MLAVASLAGMARPAWGRADDLYDLPRRGSVHLLHFTDCHAQLLPVHYREPDTNLGVGPAAGKPPHLVGDALRRRYGWAARSRLTHAFTHLNFAEAARRYGKLGGFTHLATLIKRLRTTRPNAVLLDGGDTWQGSATALWTQGHDMAKACRALGVSVMTGHWEFTLGAQRVQQMTEQELSGAIEFIAHNVQTRDFGDAVFASHAWREVNGVAVAIIGQAFPHTAIANPAHLVPDWSFGLHEQKLQTLVNDLRARGAAAVILLSHNGMDADLKLASRVNGIDAILGGHTHDGVPRPVRVRNRDGSTLVTNAGSNGKFLGVLDLEVRGKRVLAAHYTLLPVFADLLPADSAMTSLVDEIRAPYLAQLQEPLATTEGLLYRRGNFTGTFDQLMLDALMAVRDAPIAFSPGFRWGTTLLPGDILTNEALLNQTAITYPATTVSSLRGEQIKAILEDVADNLFNPDPYYQQGGDMVRVGGLTYSCAPLAPAGDRIRDLRLGDVPLDADKTYKVASWASVNEDVDGPPIWDVVRQYLSTHRVIEPLRPNVPRLVGVRGNSGLSR